MNLAFYELWTLALTAVLVLIALPFAGERRSGPLIAFIGIAVVQTAALLSPPALGWRIGHWNWIGKVASICVSLAVLPLLRLTRAEVGLVLPAGRRGWIVSGAGLATGVLFDLCLAVVFGPNGLPGAETLAFQSTMPGLDEELAFRGIAMALLTRGLPRTRFGLPVWVLPLAITSLWFTAVHVVSLEHGHVGFAPQAVLPVLPAGVLLALIRVGSSSLFGCVLAHNAMNVSAYVDSYFIPPTG